MSRRDAKFAEKTGELNLITAESATNIEILGATERARFSFSYELRDLRDLDGDVLLHSDEVGDNVDHGRSRIGDQPGDKLAVRLRP